MACFSWLHLTDLHCGQQEHSWLLPGVQDIFFDDLKRLSQKCGPWDLVLFTDDLTQKGTTEDFQAAQVFLEQLWKRFETFDAPLPTLLTVPGNHDLVRPTPEEQEDPSFILLQQWEAPPIVQQHFWEKPNSPYRQIVAKAFANYTDWWHNQLYTPKDIRHGLLPRDFSVSIEKEDAQLGIVGLNTSFLQLTDDDYNGKLALHARQFRKACDGDGPAWAKKHHACLLLTHHPPAWLSKTSQQDLYAEITAYGRFAWHLCGHNHETAVYEVSDSGTEPRRLWVGKSLFGLEYFGHEQERLHGYAAGRLELHGKTGSIAFWPRETRLRGGQRDIIPDLSVVLSENEHTEPRTFQLLQSYELSSDTPFEKSASEEKTLEQDLTNIQKPVRSVDPAPLRDAYLNWLLEPCGQVVLSGIDRKAAGRGTETCLKLSAIYPALLTISPEQEGREFQVLSQREQKRDRRLSALAQLNQHKHLVLLGDPGSGKSTFVNFVTMCLTGAQLTDPQANLTLLTAPLPNEEGEDEDKPQPWKHGALLPVRIILRDFAARGLPSASQKATVNHLWEFLTNELEEFRLGEYAPYLEKHLREQGGLLLFDGLDEVPEAKQRQTQIQQVIESFARAFPQCRIVITSRTYTYQQQDWRLQGFVETGLAPFTTGQIRCFVDRWYSHSAEIRGMNAENARGQAELLKQAILSNDRLYSLAERPLLLTLMASLHYWRGGSLPEKREELYNDAVDLLLDWWESPKVVRDTDGHIIIAQKSLTELLHVGKERVRNVLDALAFQAHARQTELVGTADIAEQELKNDLMYISQNPDLRPKRLLEFLSNRAGLLVPRGAGVYTFPHRTFQEYLAACYLADQDDYPENVAELARQEPNRWREVLLLAGARASRDAAASIWGLADALCYREVEHKDVTPEDVWGALLAGQALTETANLEQISPRNQSKADKVRDWLAAILTEDKPSGSPLPVVERATAGNILALLGDPRPGVGLISPPGRGEGWVREYAYTDNLPSRISYWSFWNGLFGTPRSLAGGF